MKNIKMDILNNKIVIIYKPLLNIAPINIEVPKTLNDSWPVKFYTATTPMKDYIGNIVQISGDKCSVEGVIDGIWKIVPQVKIVDKSITKLSERVMVTEHIDINGRLELIATKQRILNGSINFVNIGWSDNKKCDFIRIDAYTGDYIKMTCGTVRQGKL